MNFKDLGLSEKTLQAIDEFGMNRPTTLQIDVIPSILEGKDVFAIAPRGSGKTISYVFPLIDIISNKKGQNILIITPSSQHSVRVSDSLAIFNKYHEINEATIKEGDEDIDSEANVVIGSPDLLVELSEKVDFSHTNILVVDDINLIKSNKQLDNLEKILTVLPREKQNIVFTNRRSRETQDILDKILQTPEEIKIDKAKELEAEKVASGNIPTEPRRNTREKSAPHKFAQAPKDDEASELIKKYKIFGDKTPEFLTYKGIVVNE
ncbi:MAG: DEAD/DEAH box helicase [Lactobacillus sp.]|jgi:superfamily II DNA/RNA helicase|nr:DEAD/DEAH box helicase [Lactobacillus sp.]